MVFDSLQTLPQACKNSSMEIHRPLNDWAKTHDGMPGIPVRQHLLTVAYVTDALLHRFPRLCNRCHITASALMFLAASHDVGKLSLDFLQKCTLWLDHQGLRQKAECEGWKSVYTRWHPLISCQSLQKFLSDNQLANRKSAACWAAVIGAHHGKIVSHYSSKPIALKKSELCLEDERQNCLRYLWEHFGRPEMPLVQSENNPMLWCVAGLITLADWIGSDESFFPADKPLDEEALHQRATEAVNSIGLGLPPVERNLSFADIFSGRTPYPLQDDAAKAITVPGIYIIEAPMGMGKTEAALWASYHLMVQGKADGIFFALPTQATSNRMFLRFADFVHRICHQASPVQLIHGNSWLQDDLKALACPASPECCEDPCWFNTSRRALFAPFGVGTVDQALLAVLVVRHFPLRRFGLAGKVVILDEVHTYDMYTGRLVYYLCHELKQLGCTVIILSATLTERIRCDLLGIQASEEKTDAPYPRISGLTQESILPEKCPPSLPDKCIRVEHLHRGDAMAQALELAGTGAQILWICNTVAQAQTDYTELKQRAADANNDSMDIGLLHSRFPFFRRGELEDEWMARFGVGGDRQTGAILVSTQIVEQSVDLDADLLFSELAPTDMLLQRLGRLWRHPRSGRPVDSPLFCLLRGKSTCEELRHMKAASIKACLEGTGAVYSPYILLRTLELWESLDELSLPSGIRKLMAQTYAEKDDLPSGWEELYKEDNRRRQAEEQLADMSTDIWQVALDDNVALKTRLSADGALVVLARKRDGARITLLDGNEITLPVDGSISLQIAKKLHRNTVRIPYSCLDDSHSDAQLSLYHIDGCLLAGGGAMTASFIKPGRGLYWNDTLGVVIHKEER